MRVKIWQRIKQTFIAGLAVVIPVGISIYTLFFIIDLIDGVLDILPKRIHPDSLIGYHIPGLGVIVTLVITILAGLMIRSYLGKKLMDLGENFFRRIPVVRSIYDGSKQVVDSFIANRKKGFKKVVLVRFPHTGLYSLGFVTGETPSHIKEGKESQFINVYVPTTPNPTSGYLVLVPSSDVVEVDMTVNEALSFIVSCGLVQKPEVDLEKKA
ncbi:MAG: DUF502 domain-containing protein [Syntrophales bacterium]|nr:DUF502 domain-containing protein [Syntrophales bacterium]